MSLSFQIPPEDIQWEGVDPGISLRGAHSGPGHGIKKSMSHVGYPSGGRGRGGSIKGESRREFLPTQNGFTKKVSDDIELFNTETLVQEVCMVTWHLFHLTCQLLHFFGSNSCYRWRRFLL